MTRDELIKQNLGLVHSCARKFVCKGIEYDDLYSAGCVGLIKAIDNFDQTKGFQLSTYAVPVILGEIKRLFRDGSIIKVSRSLKELSLKASKIADEYKKQHADDIPISILSEKLGVDVYKANEALSLNTLVTSLSVQTDDEKKELDIPTCSLEDRLIEKLTLCDVLNELSPEDRKLIELRYFKHKTQVEVAAALDMTQVQVSRKEKKLLLFMRQKLS